VYVLEKIHGTSAHVGFNAQTGALYFFAGELKDQFPGLFDHESLKTKFHELFGGQYSVVVYGELYGGKVQGQSRRYGPHAKFVAFDVKLTRAEELDGKNSWWMDVPKAASVAGRLGLEFVDYELVNCSLDELNRWRDMPSVQAKRNGVEGDMAREGVVIRPTEELFDSQGHRLIAKHKIQEFMETATPRDPAKAQKMFEARQVAKEFVTEVRLQHVLQKIEGPHTVQMIPTVIAAMIEDVEREGCGEFTMTADVRKQIGNEAVVLYKKLLKAPGAGDFGAVT
jgi:hypothetical protein